MFVKVTVFVSPALMTSIFLCSTIGFGDVELLEVTRVLHGHLEREIGRRRDLVVARRPARFELLPVGQGSDGDERAAVFSARRPAGRRAVNASPHLGHRLRARKLGIRDDGGAGNVADVADVLLL
jgi:hypothetical protein